MTPSLFRTLTNSEFFQVIRVGGEAGNLVLTTLVVVNTVTNECVLQYSVRTWNDHESHRFIRKDFKSYLEAYKYYVEMYAKHKED